MRKFRKHTAVCMAACVLLGGCAGQNASATTAVQESTIESEEEQALSDAGQVSAADVLKVTTITEIFGDGQKPSALALEYPGEVDAASLSAELFQVEGQTIEAVHTNAEPALTDSDVPGNYVILKLAYENTVNSESMGPGRGGDGSPGGRPDSDGGPGFGDKAGNSLVPDGGKPDSDSEDGNSLFPGEKPDSDGKDGNAPAPDGEKPDSDGKDGSAPTPGGGPGPDGRMGADVDGGMLRGGPGKSPESDMSVSVVQTGDVLGTDGTVYLGSDTAILSGERIDLIARDFQLLEYTDTETGCTIPYSIYLPESYDESKEYPLLFFVADASANSDDLTRNITQGNGAAIWATAEEQAKHECIVVSPQYTNTLIDSIGALTTDENVWTDGLTLVSNLLFYVIDEYSVDENRIYGTGQSQGCMTNIAISDKYPELFAAQYLVAGQWNVEEMSAMKDKNLWIVVCEGDTKAYPGMNAATESWEALGSQVARSEMWDSTSSPEQLDELTAQMEAQNCKINYTVFEGGNHTYTWSIAYNIEGIRDWLFSQTKE